MLGAADATVEARLKDVEQVLLGKGLKPEQIAAAVKNLGAVKTAPTKALVSQPGASPLDLRDRVAAMTQEAAQALQSGDRAKAAELIALAEQAGVPDAWMLPGQLTLTQVKQQLAGVTTASATQPIVTAGTTGGQPTSAVSPGVFQPAMDSTSTQPAGAQVELVAQSQLPGNENASGEELYRRGIELLTQGNREAAYETFQRAWKFKDEMDPALRSQLSDKLTSMQAVSRPAESVLAVAAHQRS